MSTRCSETYETKTALLSLFGVPLWYFSQSPRVAIQVSRRPGCHMHVPALSSHVLLFGGVCVPLPQRCRLEHASPESTVQSVPRAAAPDPGAESRTSRSPPSPLAQRRFLKPLLALLVSGLGAGEAARAVPCWASPSLGGVPYGSDPGLSGRAQPGLPLGSLAFLQAGRKDPAGDPEPQARGGRLVHLERRR